VAFRLKDLAALVDPSIKHDRVRRVFEVAAAHWGDGGVRGTSAGWGGSGFTVLSLGADVLG
jgi:galactokinase